MVVSVLRPPFGTQFETRIISLHFALVGHGAALLIGGDVVENSHTIESGNGGGQARDTSRESGSVALRRTTMSFFGRHLIHPAHTSHTTKQCVYHDYFERLLPKNSGGLRLRPGRTSCTVQGKDGLGMRATPRKKKRRMDSQARVVKVSDGVRSSCLDGS